MFSGTAVYALRAVVYLAEHSEERPVRVAEMAGNLEVPQNYLAKILNELVRSDVLTSTRGKHGGFSSPPGRRSFPCSPWCLPSIASNRTGAVSWAKPSAATTPRALRTTAGKNWAHNSPRSSGRRPWQICWATRAVGRRSVLVCTGSYSVVRQLPVARDVVGSRPRPPPPERAQPRRGRGWAR